MNFSARNVLLTLVIFCGLILAIGCTRKDDVVDPLVSSTITLNPKYLPELDTLYAYELWMVKVQNAGDDFTSAGAEYISLRKFKWDNYLHAFRDLEGNILESEITLPESWFAYDYIVVTVENNPDPNTDTPSGVYMIVDEVVDQEIRPIMMKFPVSTFLTTGFFFVGSPSDDTTYWDFTVNERVRVSENEEKGLWVCSRFWTQRNLHDTLSVDSLQVLRVIDTLDTIGKWDPDTVDIKWPGDPPDSIFEIIFDSVVFGYDTLQHRRIEVEWEVEVDTLYDYIRFVYYDIDSITTPAYPYPLGVIEYFEYAGPLEELPNIVPYGWRYNTWVTLDQDSTGSLDNFGMDLKPVIPFGDGTLESFTGPNHWGVLPLGAFNDPVAPDISNPYTSNREVPQFPGEDFVTAAAAPRFDNLNLLRVSVMDWGYVIIGMEPDPSKVTINAETNFPLFVLSEPLVSGDDPSADNVHTFHNWSQFLPQIEVIVFMHN
jgi:hypothetical protein